MAPGQPGRVRGKWANHGWCISLGAALLSGSAQAIPPRGQAQDSVAESLTAQAREHPDTTRDALSNALHAAAYAGQGRERALHMQRAQRLANAYANAWSDSFFIRQVTRFASASPAERRDKVIADSLRRAGNVAVGSEGTPVAMALWRESLRHAKAAGDSSAIAPALLSIGAGFYRFAQFDSAIVFITRAEQLAKRIGDRRTTGNAIGVLASVRKDQGEFDAAIGLYKKATSVRAGSGDRRGIAADANNLGLIAQRRGDFRIAATSFERALSINRRDNRPGLVALNLNNLAAVATTTGEYSRAELLYREALALQRQSGDAAETGFTLHGLGKLYLSRGDYRQAEVVLKEAMAIHRASGAVPDAVLVMVDLAAVESAAGSPESARMILEEAVRAASRVKAPIAVQGSLALARGDLAVKFGTFSDADAEYSRAIQLYRASADSAGLPQALEGRAALMQMRGNDRGALALLNDARRIELSRKERRSAALTSLTLANVQFTSGDADASRKTILQAQQTLRSVGDAVGEAAALVSLGDMALHGGAARNAAVLYRRGLKRLGSRDASEVKWQLHTGLATTLRSDNSLAAAAEEFRIAIAIGEKSAASLRRDENRLGFLSDKWSAYSDLAMVEIARGRVAEAFQLSERMRAQQMLALLQRGRIVRPARMSGKEQDLRRQIDALTQRLETTVRSEPATREPALFEASGNPTRTKLDAAQKEYARLLIELRATDPALATLVMAKTRPWSDVASRPKPDQAFLEYLITDSVSVVFVVTSDTVVAVDLHVGRGALADLVEFARRTMDGSQAQSKPLWRVPLRRLYRTLVTPIESKGLLAGKTTLFIAPHGDLHFLSFAALIAPVADHFLVERFQVAYTPSATIWLQLGERHVGEVPSRVLALAPNVARLPGSQHEAMAIGRIYGKNAELKIGPAATLAALRAALPSVGVVHLGTFGVLNKHNPLFSFIELAPSNRDDGRLEVNAVFGLPLTGQLVVLSACQTALGSGALGDVPPGDDWGGLVQAFLQAGARSVVATLWPVEDRATGELMEQFYIRLAPGATPVSALAEAQRSLIRNPATSPPGYWAGFTLTGVSQ